MKSSSSKKYEKGYKYSLDEKRENLIEYQRSCLDEIKEIYPTLFWGYQLREGLRLVFQSRVDKVEEELKGWLSWASRSKLSRKIRRRKEDIIATVKYGVSNARIESMNDKIKVLILKSYVFRNTQNLIDMLMIVCFGLCY